MPLIEELPVTGPTRVSHGWAYVPDTGPIAAMAPPGSRKRNRNDAGTTNATATAKQQKAVQQRLESLDKENYKDNVSVPIPARTGANARESKTGKKTTSNVRRILTYQRTFQHYLADEEAGIGGTAISAQPPPPTLPRADSRRKSGITRAEATPVKTSGRSKRRESEIDAAQTPTATPVPARRGPGRPRRNPKPEPEDVEMPDAAEPTPQEPSTQQLPTTPSQATTPTQPKPSYDPTLDSDPLLRTLNLPVQPSSRVMQLLLSEPPLTYTAARAKPLVDGKAEGVSSILTAKPPRHFCALCGYWGKVKCRKCGEWTCGLMECWKGHEGVCVALGMY